LQLLEFHLQPYIMLLNKVSHMSFDSNKATRFEPPSEINEPLNSARPLNIIKKSIVIIHSKIKLPNKWIQLLEDVREH